MSRGGFTVAKNPGRQRARQRILQEANRTRTNYGLATLRMRHIQQAVCVVRRRRLVKDSVLTAAGFNPGPKIAADPAEGLTPPAPGRAARGKRAASA